MKALCQKAGMERQKVFLRTVFDEYSVNEQGSTLWKCRCRCKTEKTVLARSLKSGASQSCGCMRREQEMKKKDLTGKVFGDLTAVRPMDAESGCRPRMGRGEPHFGQCAEAEVRKVRVLMLPKLEE